MKKTCTKCGETKSLKDFHRDRRSRDGLRGICKPCRSGHMAAYYGANRDAKRTYQAKYRAANAEKVRRVDAARYAARRDQRLGWQIAYGRDNPHVQWRNGYRKRARRYGFAPVVEDFTRADVIARHGAACTHCGGPFEELDHYPVPVALGGHHTLENVRPSCVPCNRAETAAIRERRRAS